MAPPLDHEVLECGYRNDTDRMVILVCRNCEDFELERVVFPFELLVFSCPANSEVHVFTSSAGEPVLREHCRARDLQVRTVDWVAHPRLDASLRDQVEALRQQHEASPTEATRCQLAIQEHRLRQWLPG